ncbi:MULTISPECIES: magnesium transporter [unclassified Paracoccus (in: a-proteobacteria)]|uniref:magnesium transporter n=1 Tax=unclassified Paracoccus (in: a-proteobacteria) TaxID=2688777 RepID=UPI00160249FE|nr:MULTISPECIES: magnesium transporter [unclassified Paracoccus (in: a-proteobacteria)]MBB1491730.1 magnesium transporter [Paracoccus sp. MC1854]MBB1496824.1 magnesium transporter [Paracoccus sp. MC1862]QQO45453.1 magnesium transporter [Paracoccus sp. MC1862]
MTENRPESDGIEDDFVPRRGLVAEIAEAIDAGDGPRLHALLDPLHGADIADVIEQLTPQRRIRFVRLYSGEFDAEILSEIDESIREEVLEQLPAEVLADAVREMDSDDVVDLVEDLEGPERETILSALDETDRVAVEQSLNYPEYSAGRLMQSEVVTAPEHWTVGETIDFLRSEEWLPDQFYHVILVDPRRHPIGYVTLGRLLSSQRATRLADIAEDSFRSIDVLQDEGDVAYAFNQYHLISAPVVDADGRLVGVITIDDAMNVLDEEHEEDVLRLAGVGEESHVSDTALRTARQRLPWLVANLFTASLSAMVITMFENTIAALVTLAALMPIVASTGGIAGTQSLAVAVRGLATRDLNMGNARRVVIRELLAGMLNGIGLALLLSSGAFLLFGDPLLGVVLGSAMIVNQIVAALAGVLVPLLLSRLGLDPALASGTFVTTLTDVMGFFAFLGLATWILI